MPPPPEEKPLPLPRPKPKPKPDPPKPKPKPKPKTGPEPEPKPRPEPPNERYSSSGTVPPDPLSCADTCSGPCALLPHCSQPPPAPAATVHLSSSRLPTPLIALSASLLAASAVLLLALLVHRLVRRRRRRREALAAQHDEEGGQVLAGAVAEGVGGEAEEEEEEEGAADAAVHHVWYIRTKGLDERAIAAIAAVVYDAKKRVAVDEDGGGGGDGDGSCAVCLAEFRDGETLRLLPRCGHAFHRGCIDTWLRAHVNCPLCRAPVQVASGAGAAAANPNTAPGTATATATPGGGGEPERNPGAVQTGEEAARAGVPERGVRRAASMVALPRRAWPEPDVTFRAPASASQSGREEDMTGLGKIMRLLKFSDALEMAGMGAGRSVSFSARSCQRLPEERSGPSAAGVSSDEVPPQ